jgi:hypothetical protein
MPRTSHLRSRFSRGAVIASLVALVLGLALMGGRADARTSEAQRIEHLIRSVETLSNAKFVRNNSAYDAREAADHLRLKLREAGARVRTAEDFIRFCASKSSVSGKPYQIRFADGKVMTSEAFLRAKLSELDKVGK